MADFMQDKSLLMFKIISPGIFNFLCFALLLLEQSTKFPSNIDTEKLFCYFSLSKLYFSKKCSITINEKFERISFGSVSNAWSSCTMCRSKPLRSMEAECIKTTIPNKVIRNSKNKAKPKPAIPSKIDQLL